jgi:Rab-like protein 5
MSTVVKILVVGPTKAGKSTFANIIGELAEGPSEQYRPTVGCRIVELERDPPPAVASFGKFTLELWDVSGDFKYEKCWGPIQKEAHGIIFVYDPQAPNYEESLAQFVAMFPKAMMLSPKFCLAIANHHNTSGGVLPSVQIPKCMDALEKHNGTAEDTNGVFQAFEKYLIKLLKLLGDKQRDEEEGIMA